MTVLGAILAPLSAPMWLAKLGYLIDNPWANAVDRAGKTGLVCHALKQDYSCSLYYEYSYSLIL